MEKFELSDMVKGWFIGDFEPSLFQTEDVEVAVKEYQKGDNEGAHYHKIATEFTVILNGRVRMGENEFGHGSIIKMSPGTVTDFEALTNVTTVVVKLPGAKGDKYITNE